MAMNYSRSSGQVSGAMWLRQRAPVAVAQCAKNVVKEAGEASSATDTHAVVKQSQWPFLRMKTKSKTCVRSSVTASGRPAICKCVDGADRE